MTDWTLRLVPLQLSDAPAMMALQTEMIAALPDPRWYFPSTLEEWQEQVSLGHARGIFEGNHLIAFCVYQRGEARPAHNYALCVGEDPTLTYDFCDVMVSPQYRRQGIHSAFIAACFAQARQEGCRGVYCTVDPDNLPSQTAFRKAGFVPLLTKPAYDGRIRTYLYCALT